MENQNKEQAVNVNIANYTGEKPVQVDLSAALDP